MNEKLENRRAYHFDWRMAIVTFSVVVGQGLLQYGATMATIKELDRRMERVEQKIDDRMMPRQEFEKRHQDMSDRVEDLRARLQKLELERSR